jgi:hypothetical protein
MAPRKAKAEPKAKPKAAPKRKTRTKAESTGATKIEKRDAKGQFAEGHAGGPGRDTVYTDELGAKIAALLAEGLTVNEIEAMEGMPSGRTIRTWALNLEHPFSPMYTRGREIGYMKMADDLTSIMDDGRNDWMERHNSEGEATGWQVNGEHVQRSRLRVEGRKWLLSKALPKIYGDKLALTDADGGVLKVQMVA